MPKKMVLKRRYNKDGSISLLYRGKVVQKLTGFGAADGAEAFEAGWYGIPLEVYRSTVKQPGETV